MKIQSKKVFLSVVVPAYNEENRIGATLTDLQRYFSRKKFSHEVIVVSDGSTDGTTQVVRGFMPNFPHLRLLDNSINMGKGHAVRSGMLNARGRYRLFMDADNSVKIDAVEPFMRELVATGSDVAIGSIAVTESEVIEHNGWHRRTFGSLSKLLIRAVATPGIYDTQRGFKLFTERAANAIFPLQRINRFGFDIELLTISQAHGFGVRELPVSWNNPAGSKVTLRSYADSFVELWKIYGNSLRGLYSPMGALAQRDSRERETSMAVLVMNQVPALFSRLVNEIATSKARLQAIKRALARRGLMGGTEIA